MKSLGTLIKLQKQKVNDQRLILAKMHEHLDSINQQITAHEQQKKDQKTLLDKDPSYSMTYGDYLEAALKRSEDLAKKHRSAEEAVRIALDKLGELFEEQKRYEIAEQNRILAEQREELRQETIVLDEIGGVSFARRQSGL